MEPSAGSGGFITSSAIPLDRWEAYDIDVSNTPPHLAGVIKQADYLSASAGILENHDRVVVGNPPFGKKADLALRFLNKSLVLSETVAFILPVQFDKYGTQQQILPDAKLVYSEHLPTEAFHTPDNKPVNHLRTGLYVFTTRPLNGLVDCRLYTKPATTHKDFKLWQYNATKQALKYFDKSIYSWDFAVLRQGYGDFNYQITNPSELNPKKQYMFIRANSPEVLDRLKNIDYNELALKNTSTPGFGKADLVDLYNKIDK